MAEIKIDKSKCKGCGLCLKACPFEAIELVDKIAVVNEKCTLCKKCLTACPAKFGALAFDEGAVKLKEYDHSEYKNIWVFTEQRAGKLMPVAEELIGEAKRLASEMDGDAKVISLLVGNGIEKLAKTCFESGSDEVLLVEHELLEKFTTDGYTKVIVEQIKEKKPSIVLFGATHIGRDVAPRIAARLGTGLTADCTRLDVKASEYVKYANENTTLDTSDIPKDDIEKKFLDSNPLLQTRPAFGGNLMATIMCPRTRPQMATVRPGVMKRREKVAGATGEIVKVKPDLKASDIRTTVKEIVKSAKEIVSLTDAEIICSGGRGLKEAKGFELIKKFADKVGGVVGSSRAAVDAGWIDHSHQVGQTGTTVRPKIYFACGISGAIQHQAGMSGSEIIVAINTDPDAPIFEIADFGIVGDLYKVVPELIEEWDNAETLYEASYQK